MSSAQTWKWSIFSLPPWSPLKEHLVSSLSGIGALALTGDAEEHWRQHMQPHPSHTLQSLFRKLFSQISARWWIRKQQWKFQSSFPLFIPSPPYFLASPSLFSSFPPHSIKSPSDCPSQNLFNFILSLFLLPHSLPFNSVSIFVSLFSMHCHSSVNFWILPFGSSFL